MKVYVILECHRERMIRGVTLSADVASRICKSFSHLGIYFEEYEPIDSETLNNFLEVKKC